MAASGSACAVVAAAGAAKYLVVCLFGSTRAPCSCLHPGQPRGYVHRAAAASVFCVCAQQRSRLTLSTHSLRVLLITSRCGFDHAGFLQQQQQQQQQVDLLSSCSRSALLCMLHRGAPQGICGWFWWQQLLRCQGIRLCLCKFCWEAQGRRCLLLEYMAPAGAMGLVLCTVFCVSGINCRVARCVCCALQEDLLWRSFSDVYWVLPVRGSRGSAVTLIAGWCPGEEGTACTLLAPASACC